MEKPVSTELTKSNITQVLNLLVETPQKLSSLSQGFSEDQVHQPLGAGERSFIEDLAHLANSEARSSEAIYLALLAEEPVIVGIHPERQFGKLLRFDLLPFPDLLAYFRLRRVIFLRVLNELSLAQWSRRIREPGKKRQESVYWQARSLAMHEAEHLADLASKLGKSP